MQPAAQDPCAKCFGFLVAALASKLVALRAAVEPPLFLAYPLQIVHHHAPLEE